MYLRTKEIKEHSRDKKKVKRVKYLQNSHLSVIPHWPLASSLIMVSNTQKLMNQMTIK